MSKVVLCFGRFNPPHVGTEKLFNFAKDLAIKEKAAFKIYASHSQDTKKNPLDYKIKMKFLKQCFPQFINNIVISEKHTIFEILRELQNHYTYVILVVGEDRVKQFQKAIDPYINSEHPDALRLVGFDVVSAGDRDPDSDESTEASSSTKMREFAKENNFAEFKAMLPSHLNEKQSSQLFQLVKKGLSISESINIILMDSKDMTKILNEDNELAQEDERLKKFNRYKEFFVKMMDEATEEDEVDKDEEDSDSEVGQWIKVGTGWVVRFNHGSTEFSAAFYPLDSNETHWKFTYFKTGQRDSSDIKKFGETKDWQAIWKLLVQIIKDFIRIFSPLTIKFIGMSSSKRPTYYKELYRIYIRAFINAFKRLSYTSSFDFKDLDKAPSFVIRKHSHKEKEDVEDVESTSKEE